MAEHLTEKDLRDFRANKLDRAGLLRFDDHIASCDACRLAIASSAEAANASSRFARAVVAPDHLTYGQLEGYLDGRLSAIERATVDSHIESCDECRGDLGGLSAATKPEPARSSVFDWLFARPVPVFASLFLVAGATVVVWMFSDLTELPLPAEMVAVPESPRVENSPLIDEATAPEQTPTAVLATAITDGGETVGIGQDGELAGYNSVPASFRSLMKNTLSAGKLSVPDLSDLKGASGALMGDEAPTVFHVRSPIGKVLRTSSATFSWDALAGAESYVVEVFDKDFKKVASSGELKSTTWKTDLPRGRTYIWQVTATKEGEVFKSPQRPAPEARFRIIDAKTANDLAAVSRSNPRAHFLLGVAYASAGLIDDARRELELAVKENPRADLPRQLLRQLPRK